MVWSYQVVVTRTGAPVQLVSPSACSWTRRLTGTGTGSVELKLRDEFHAIPRAMVRDLLTPNKHTLVVRWGSGEDPHVAFAGVITGTSYSRDTGTVAANLAEVRMLFAKRMTGGVNQYGAPWNLTYAGRSAAGAVRALLTRAFAPSSEWSLPIDLPPDGAGSLSRQVDFFETITISDLIAEVESQAGVVVDFRPYYSGGVLRWESRVLSAAATVGAADLPVTVPESRVVGLTVAYDGAKQVTGVLAVGNGTGEDMVTAFAPTTGSGATVIPVRDERREAKDLKTAAQLQAFADSEYALWKDPVEQWSFTVRLDDELTPDMVQPARLLRMDVRQDEWIADDVYQQRVIALAGDMTLAVKPEVQRVG